MALNSMKDIAKLLDFHGLLVDKAGNMETSFTGICNNSKEINQGELFICKGLGFKKEYLEGAIKDGATCYVAEMDYNVDLPYVLTKDIRKAQSLIAAAFYDHPYRAFCLTGITGTKGKTTTTYDLEALLSTYAGRPTGLLSTVERFVGDDHMVSHNTTAESLDLEKLFLRAKENNLPYVTMEVSSQAYKQDRVFGLHFNYGVFLNFGEDHISPNEHENLEDYFACKLQLMTHCDTAIICKSTDRFDNIYRVAKAHARKVMVLGLEDESCDLTAINIKKEHLGFTFDVKEKSTGKVYPYSTIQEGRFNIENLLVAICIGSLEGASHQLMAKALERATAPGRMNVVWDEGIRVIVDYAHNKLSFEALFSSLKKDNPSTPIWVVTGTQGERDPQRRIDVGELCGKNADHTIFTADDPGYESLGEICEGLAAAARPFGHGVEIIHDRSRAVEQALINAPEGAIVVLAGKGGEKTQRVCGGYEPYESDVTAAKRVMESGMRK